MIVLGFYSRNCNQTALLDSTDVQDGVFQVCLLPAQVHQLGGSKTMPEGQQNHGCVTMAPAVVPGRLNQPLDLAFGQVFAGPVRGIGFAQGQSRGVLYTVYR